jgi:hypothetical protein
LAQPVIAFSAPFWGVIRYSFSGTAAGDDAPGLSGAVRVYGGNSVVIPVSLGDNGAIETLKDLVLTLEPGSGYTVSPATSTVTVTIEDNDALWRGSLFFEQAVLGIQLRIEEIGGAFSAALEDDGLGILPEGEHATSILFSEDSFVATSADLSLNASESLVNLPAIQRLELSAIQGMPDQRVSRDEVRGVATLKTLYPAGPHLNLTNAGTFLLLRPPGRPRTSEVELINEL